MMLRPSHLAVACAALHLISAALLTADTNYVDLYNPHPDPPYTNWSMAATNIQDAVAAATSGDWVVVRPAVRTLIRLQRRGLQPRLSTAPR